MKKALSLVLAVLMIAGCMSFVVSAEEEATTYSLPALYEKYNLPAFNLTTPTANAPEQDGTIGETEYQYKAVIDNTAAAVPGDATAAVFYAPGAEPMNYTVTTSRTGFVAGSKITEYYDYDSEWVYFGMKFEGSDYQNINRWRITFERADLDFTQTEINGIFGYLMNRLNAAFGLSYGYEKTGTNAGGAYVSSDQISRNYIYKSLDQYGYGANPSSTAYEKADARKLLFNDTVGKSADNNSSTWEIKFSRRFIGGDSNVFYLAPAFVTNPGNVRTHCGIRFDDAAAAQLTADGFVPGSSPARALAPRLLVLGTEDVTTSVEASVRISSDPKANGLRFKTVVDNDFIAELKAVPGNEVSVGTLIAPSDLLNGAALDHNFATKLDVVANVDKPFAADEDFSTYAGSITNMKSENLAREFTAVGYVKVTNEGETTYYYSAVAATRKASWIASYITQYDAASYTEDQLALIGNLIPAA